MMLLSDAYLTHPDNNRDEIVVVTRIDPEFIYPEEHYSQLWNTNDDFQRPALQLCVDWSNFTFSDVDRVIANVADKSPEHWFDGTRLDQGDIDRWNDGVSKGLNHQSPDTAWRQSGKSEFDRMLDEAAERAKFSRQEPDKGMER
jgi:hypothetical protein